MRVSTRIISGTAIMMVLAVLALVHLAFVQHISNVVNDFSTNIKAAKIAEAILSDLDAVEDSSKKYFGNEKPDLGNVRYAHSHFEDDVAALHRELGPERKLAELARLEEGWVAYVQQWNQKVSEWDAAFVENQKVSDQSAIDKSIDTFMGSATDLITPVLTRGQTLSNTIQDSADRDRANATSLSARVEKVSWVAAVIALVIVIVFTFLLRTINESLRRLTAGTRMISEGQFWHRLPTDGGDEFSELAADFNSMSQRLGQLDTMKKDFVSHVSHELKAPLASIRQTFLLLLEQIPGPLTDQQKRLLRLSNNSAERLTAMVGNLLDVSRMEAGTMEYAVGAVDLLALTKTVSEEFEIQAKEKDVTLRVESSRQKGFVVDCDRDRMTQVIGNLFDNALKFSPRGTEIVATIAERMAGADRFLVLSVQDSGIGVPNDHKERIFRKFHQVKQGRKMSGQGVGLGLAICNSIIEAHRGRIWVEDNPAGGSIFCFEIPAMARVEATTA